MNSSTNFKGFMNILPPSYTSLQLEELDSKTKKALLDKFYNTFKNRFIEKNLKNFNNFKVVAEQMWILGLEKPYDEFDDFIEEASYDEDFFKSTIEEFYNYHLRPVFTDEKTQIWDLLQICEILVKNPSIKTLEENFPSEEVLSRPKVKIKKAKPTDNVKLPFETEEEKELQAIEQKEYKEKALKIATDNSIKKETSDYNEIFEKYWVGYRFDSVGNLLPTGTKEEQNVIEAACLNAKQKGWDSFLEHYTESLNLAKGSFLDARGSSKAAIAALEGLLKQLTNMPNASLGQAKYQALSKNLIDAATSDKIKALWDESNTNNTRHAGTPLFRVSIEHARRVIVDVGEVALTIMN